MATSSVKHNSKEFLAPVHKTIKYEGVYCNWNMTELHLAASSIAFTDVQYITILL